MADDRVSVRDVEAVEVAQRAGNLRSPHSPDQRQTWQLPPSVSLPNRPRDKCRMPINRRWPTGNKQIPSGYPPRGVRRRVGSPLKKAQRGPCEYRNPRETRLASQPRRIFQRAVRRTSLTQYGREAALARCKRQVRSKGSSVLEKGRLAQLVRAPARQAGGRRFESDIAD